MKMMALLIFAILMFSSIPIFSAEYATALELQPLPRAKWTIMVYMDGDNDLEDMMIEDLNEMEAVGSTDDVRIVAQIDRWDGFSHNSYKDSKDNTSNGNWTDTRRYYVTQDSDPDIIHSQLWAKIGEKNMGDPQTLQDFIDWSKYYFPANHYLLILEDHGHALPPMVGNTGVCWDWTSDQDHYERLTPSELRTVNFNVEILALDACEMAYTEFFYELTGKGIGIIIASEEVMPADGLPYHPPDDNADIIGYITKNSDMPPPEFASNIVEEYGKNMQMISILFLLSI